MQMAKSNGTPQPRPLWAYAYEIVPPQREHGLRAIQALLDQEHSDAQSGGRTWGGRVVFAQHITHILVVSDGPEQDLGVNRRLEAEFVELGAEFAMTTSLAVVDDLKKAPPRTGRPPAAN